MIVSFCKIQDYCSKNLPKVLLFFSFTAISSISPEANTDEYKKHSKASQNPLRLNIYIHLFRYIPGLLETHFFLSLWNCINPFIRVSKKAAALSVIIFYRNLSRMSSAKTCHFCANFVPRLCQIIFTLKQGPGDQLQALSTRLQTLLWRSRFSRQSIRRPSPIKDRYSLFHGSVPFHCHPTVSNGGRTSTETVAWVLDLALVIL